jgi:hypothetical protein
MAVDPQEQYRRNALQCLQLANEASNPDIKARLTAMAQAWQRLVEQAARNSKVDCTYKMPQKKT